MEEDGEVLTPFWLQSTRNNRGRRRSNRVRHGLSSFFLSSGLLISILLVTAVSFLVFVVPSTISFSIQIFRPNTVKKSWDSLNIVLVLFALVFGFLSRNKNEEDTNFDEHYQTTTPSTDNEFQKSNPSTPQGWYNYSLIEAEKSNQSNSPQWYGYLDQTAFKNANNSRSGLLRRTSSSYPDLLKASSRLISVDDPWQCYDDMRIDTPRFSDGGQLHRRRSWKYTFDDSQLESKSIYVDTFVNRPKEPSNTQAPSPLSSPSPAAPPPPQSPPPASQPLPPSRPPASTPLQNEKPKPTHKRERRRKRKDDALDQQKEPISLPATPPPPPPPPLPQYVDQKNAKSDKKTSGATATKDFLNSLYHKKKKKQRQKSVENFDALLHEPQIPPLHFQLPPPSPPPPPPPPPPPSVFHNMFSSKKSKRKTRDTVISVPIPPPLPPLEVAITSGPNISQIVTVATQKPLQAVKVRSFNSEEGNTNSGGESPLIPIPPPPPPPPPFLKSPAWKFVLQGDYVRVNSNLSSRSGSPDPDEVESDNTPTSAEGGDASPFPQSPLFWPSPDVDTKAENFISKFRAGLKLEKKISMSKKQGVGLSNLGPDSGPTHI